MISFVLSDQAKLANLELTLPTLVVEYVHFRATSRLIPCERDLDAPEYMYTTNDFARRITTVRELYSRSRNAYISRG